MLRSAMITAFYFPRDWIVTRTSARFRGALAMNWLILTMPAVVYGTFVGRSLLLIVLIDVTYALSVYALVGNETPVEHESVPDADKPDRANHSSES